MLGLEQSNHARFLATALVSLLAVQDGPLHARQDAANRDFSGRWRFNAEQSTDTRQAAPGREGGRGERAGGAGGRGRDGRGDGGDVEQVRERLQQAQELLRDTPESMLITHAEPKVALVFPDGRHRTLYTDDRKMKASNGNADVQSKWDGRKLVVETRFGDQVTVKETYELAGSGQQLVVVIGIETGGRGGGGRNSRRVYDKVTETP